MIAVLFEDTTESSSKNAFADVAACTSEHDGVKFSQ
jgi:hypothetical protein